MEGELNGEAASRAFSATGGGVDTQGVAGAQASPYIDGLVDRPVYIYADRANDRDRWATKLVGMGYTDIRLLPPFEGAADFSDRLGRDGPEVFGRTLRQDLADAKHFEPNQVAHDPLWEIELPDGARSRLELPDGYRVNSDSEIMLDRDRGSAVVASRPILVVGRIEDVITRRSDYLIRFVAGDGGIRERRVSTEELALGPKLVSALAAVDAPVCGPRANSLMTFLDAQRNVNRDRIPTTRVSSQLGLHGKGISGPHFEVGGAARYTGPLASRFRHGDDAEAYAKAWRAIAEWGDGGWVLQLIVGLAILGPIMAALKITRVPIVLAHGGSNPGKSTILRFAGGLYFHPLGAPFELEASDISRTRGLMQTLQAMGGFPVMLDEVHLRDSAGLEAILYHAANGEGYVRGGLDGTPQETARIYSPLFLAGESPVHFQNVGARNRVLSINADRDYPLGGRDVPERARLLETAWDTGSGFLGPKVLAAIIVDQPGFFALVESAEQGLAETLRRQHNEGHEWVRTLAGVDVALGYVDRASDLNPDARLQVGLQALSAVAAGRFYHDPARKALEALVNLIVSRSLRDSRSSIPMACI